LLDVAATPGQITEAGLHNDITLDTGVPVTRELVLAIVDEEIAKLPDDADAYTEAKRTFVEVAVADDFVEFLTLPAYDRMPCPQA
jgi:malate synthase